MKNTALKSAIYTLPTVCVAIAAGTLIAYATVVGSKKPAETSSTTTTITAPPPVGPAKINPAVMKSSSRNKNYEVIELNDKNTVVMDTVFTDKSVQFVITELQRLGEHLSSGDTVYLVLNTPGGDVEAGLRLFDYAHALPFKVKTLTIFAASMGFHTAQQLDERLILANGTLMSHPASFGVRGDTPYQLASRLNWILAMINTMEQSAADRMNVSLSLYKDMTHDEYWVTGESAVKDNAADKVVYASCGKFASPTRTRTEETLFGSFVITVHSCPLIPGYVSASSGSRELSTDIKQYMYMLLTDKPSFVKKYITTNKYLDFQR